MLRALCRLLRCNDGEKLAFVRNVERVKAQEFASAPDSVAHGNGLFEQGDRQSTVTGKFVQ